MNALRELRDEDRDMIRRWRNLPEVAQYMYTDHAIGPEEHARWFEQVRRDPTCKYWIMVSDGQDVGVVNLSSIDLQNRRCYWAFYIGEPGLRGKGVGAYTEYRVISYVFDELGLNKLCAEVLGFNEPVLKLHAKFGFRQEGILREHVVKGGRPLDVVSIGLLKSEWDTIRPDVQARLTKAGVL